MITANCETLHAHRDSLHTGRQRAAYLGAYILERGGRAEGRGLAYRTRIPRVGRLGVRRRRRGEIRDPGRAAVQDAKFIHIPRKARDTRIR